MLGLLNVHVSVNVQVPECVFGKICRSDVHGTKGLTGWLDEFGSRGQRMARLCRIAWYAPIGTFETLCINIDRG
jgi:hypothetical protein